MDGQETKGLVGLLFDFGFTDFITTKLIKVLYIVGTGLIGIFSLGLMFTSFSQGAATGIIGVVLAPVAFLFGVAFLRVQLELVMVMFRIADSTSAMAADRGAGPQ